jgi:putative transposase
MPVAEIIRNHGISRNTCLAWKAKYAGASVSELRRLWELEAENAKSSALTPRSGSRTRRSKTS